MGFLNTEGVERLWTHIVARINEKVSSINGKTGTVNLNANEVGAVPKEDYTDTWFGVGIVDGSHTSVLRDGIIVAGQDAKGVLITNDYMETAEGYVDGKPVLGFYGTENDELSILRGIETPIQNDDAANKEYVDNAVANAGGAKIATGSYTGTGKYGGSNPCSLTFDFIPKFIVIFNSMSGAATSSSGGSYDEFIMVAIGNKGKLVGMEGATPYDPNITITGTTFKWSHISTSSYQMNTSGRTYYYIAFG